MCLRKIHDKPKLTIFPKTVYKVLLMEKGEFVTPYQKAPVELGKTYIGQFEDHNTIYDTVNNKYIEDGFIHSYVSLEEAIREKHCWDSNHTAYVIKCKIPAFTYYYKGVCNEIASRKLKYIKIVE